MLVLRIFLIGLCLFLLYVGIFAKRGWIDWRRMVHQNRSIQAKIVATQEQKEAIEKQIHGLENDRVVQERLVREVLGYVRPSDIVIEFD